jgi:hypothetical protein
MSNIKLDLSKFRHESSDEHSTTLVHTKDGHKVTLAHKSLSKDAQAQFKALADHSAKEKKPSTKDQLKETKAEVKEPIKMATGGGVLDKLLEEEPQGPLASPSKGAEFFTPENIQTVAELPVQAESAEDKFAQSVGEKTAKLADRWGVPKEDMPMLEGKAEDMVLDEKVAEKQAEAAAKQAEADSKALEFQKEAMALEQKNQKRAMLGLAPIEAPGIAPQAAAPQAPEQMQAAATPAQGMISAPAESQTAAPTAPKVEQPKIGQDFLSEDAAWQNDLNNGHITPKTYESMFASKDTLGKIGTIFGLMVSGVGSGLQGKSNMLMDMMQKEIEQDLEAQKASKQNALSFRKLAEDHLMNSANIAHMRLNDTVTRDAYAQQLAGRAAFHDLMVKTQKMPEGLLKQQAMQTLGLLSQGLDSKAISVADQINAKQALMSSMMGGDGAIEQKIGALIPHNDQKAAREELSMVKSYQDGVKDISNMFAKMKKIGGIAGNIPFSGKKTEAQTIAAQIVSTIRASMKGQGALSDQEVAQSITPLLPSATDTITQIDKKEQALKAILQNKVAGGTPTLRQYRIDPMAGMPKEDNAPVKGKDGRMYVKSPDGTRMIPVK